MQPTSIPTQKIKLGDVSQSLHSKAPHPRHTHSLKSIVEGGSLKDNTENESNKLSWMT